MKHGLKEAHLQAILEVLKTNKKIEKAANANVGAQ